MSFTELLLLGMSLAMDAFSVAICGSLALAPAQRLQGALKFGFWFGGFQFLMPVVGYGAAFWARSYIETYDHWIAFALLLYIGGNMVKESRQAESCPVIEGYGVRRMLLLALATSIDALAVGVTLAFLEVNIWYSALIIGVVTFGFGFVGGLLGFRLGERYESKATLAGGLVLILLGLKILLEHLGYF